MGRQNKRMDTREQKVIYVWTELLDLLLNLKVITSDTAGVKARHRSWIKKRYRDEMAFAAELRKP